MTLVTPTLSFQSSKLKDLEKLNNVTQLLKINYRPCCEHFNAGTVSLSQCRRANETTHGNVTSKIRSLTLQLIQRACLHTTLLWVLCTMICCGLVKKKKDSLVESIFVLMRMVCLCSTVCHFVCLWQSSQPFVSSAFCLSWVCLHVSDPCLSLILSWQQRQT